MRAINENSLTRVYVYLYVHMYVLKQICVILIFKVRKYNIFWTYLFTVNGMFLIHNHVFLSRGRPCGWFGEGGGGGTCYLVVEILVTATTSYLCHARGIAKLSGFGLIYKVIKSHQIQIFFKRTENCLFTFWNSLLFIF